MSELTAADDFIALCRLGHPLDECDSLADCNETGCALRVDVQCRECETVFVFRRESDMASDSGWYLFDSSDRLVAETCVAKRMRRAMVQARRQMRFQAHWQSIAARQR